MRCITGDRAKGRRARHPHRCGQHWNSSLLLTNITAFILAYLLLGFIWQFNNEAFNISRFGMGSAKAILFFLIVAVISMLQVWATKRKEVEM